MAGKQGHDACPLWNPPDSGEMTAGWAEQGLGEVTSGYFGMGILVENGGDNREALRHENWIGVARKAHLAGCLRSMVSA